MKKAIIHHLTFVLMSGTDRDQSPGAETESIHMFCLGVETPLRIKIRQQGLEINLSQYLLLYLLSLLFLEHLLQGLRIEVRAVVLSRIQKYQRGFSGFRGLRGTRVPSFQKPGTVLLHSIQVLMVPENHTAQA